jgi:hypothetical protein
MKKLEVFVLNPGSTSSINQLQEKLKTGKIENVTATRDFVVYILSWIESY